MTDVSVHLTKIERIMQRGSSIHPTTPPLPPIHTAQPSMHHRRHKSDGSDSGYSSAEKVHRRHIENAGRPSPGKMNRSRHHHHRHHSPDRHQSYMNNSSSSSQRRHDENEKHVTFADDFLSVSDSPSLISDLDEDASSNGIITNEGDGSNSPGFTNMSSSNSSSKRSIRQRFSPTAFSPLPFNEDGYRDTVPSHHAHNVVKGDTQSFSSLRSREVETQFNQRFERAGYGFNSSQSILRNNDTASSWYISEEYDSMSVSSTAAVDLNDDPVEECNRGRTKECFEKPEEMQVRYRSTRKGTHRSSMETIEGEDYRAHLLEKATVDEQHEENPRHGSHDGTEYSSELEGAFDSTSMPVPPRYRSPHNGSPDFYNDTKYQCSISQFHPRAKPIALPQYTLGQRGNPLDMKIESTELSARYAVALLRELDAAFVKRSDGRWCYAVLAERVVDSTSTRSNNEVMLRFVVSEDGSTKNLSMRKWGDYVRLVREPMEVTSLLERLRIRVAKSGCSFSIGGGAVVGKIGREKKSLAPTVTPLSKRGELKKEKKMSPAECLRLMGIDLANPCTW